MARRRPRFHTCARVWTRADGARFRLVTADIDLRFGGLTSWTENKEVSPKKHIAISLAGPFAGFLFGGAVYLSEVALPDLFADHFGRVTYRDLLWVNFGWGIFNLLPVLPLDGGNVAYRIEQ